MKRFLTRMPILFTVLTMFGCASTTEKGATQSTNEVVIPQYKEIDMPTQITVDGQNVTIIGKKASVGDVLKDIELAAPAKEFNKTQMTKLSNSQKLKVIYTAPSIDTPVCSMQTKTLESYAKKKPNIDFFMISADLPFAQSRFCSANALENLKTLSDFKGLSWARANGFAMQEYNLLTRAILIVDENNVIRYIEYTKEVTGETNLGNALAYIEQVMKV